MIQIIVNLQLFRRGGPWWPFDVRPCTRPPPSGERFCRHWWRGGGWPQSRWWPGSRWRRGSLQTPVSKRDIDHYTIEVIFDTDHYTIEILDTDHYTIEIYLRGCKSPAWRGPCRPPTTSRKDPKEGRHNQFWGRSDLRGLLRRPRWEWRQWQTICKKCHNELTKWWANEIVQRAIEMVQRVSY